MADPRVLEQIRVHRQAGIGEAEIRKVLHIQGFSVAETTEALAEAAAIANIAMAPHPLQQQKPSHVAMVMPHAIAEPPPLSVAPPSFVPVDTPAFIPVPTATAAPAFVVAPEPVINSIPANQDVVPQHSRGSGMKIVLVTLLVLIVLGAAGGAAYAYVQKIGPFAGAKALYTQETLISGVLAAASRIKSNTYAVSGSLNVVPRDEGAEPFTLQVSNQEDLQQRYANDFQRAQDIGMIVTVLRSEHVLPASLQTIQNDAKKLNFYGRNASILDPKSDTPYGYRLTENGRNFELTVTFETNDAIASIRKFDSYASTTRTIREKTVVFDRSNATTPYLSAEPPRPYLVALGEMARLLPAEISASLTASASADWSRADAEWKFNIDATGDFGDLSYKVNADALKKDSNYYFRINNMPSLFGASISSLKGQWIKLDPEKLKQNTADLGMYRSFGESIAKQEEQYKADRAEVVSYLKKIAAIADEEHLIKIDGAPRSERVGDRQLTRYDLRINKDSVLPFYRRATDAAKDSKYLNGSKLFSDEGMVEYLQSNEFDQVFAYLDKNVKVTLWTDAEGFPAKISYAMRLVPPDTAQQLKGKQAMLTLAVVFSEINKPVTVDVPPDAKDFSEVMRSLQDNVSHSLDDARSNGRDARRVADMKQLQLALELYYDSHAQYPTDLSALSPQFIAAIPHDPMTSGAYRYIPLGKPGKCTAYHLSGVLESFNSALSSDADAAPGTACTALARDFEGRSLSCDGARVASAQERCYDLTP